jgi:hypothetical protein
MALDMRYCKKLTRAFFNNLVTACVTLDLYDQTFDTDLNGNPTGTGGVNRPQHEFNGALYGGDNSDLTSNAPLTM